MAQRKEQNKAPEKELNEEEIDNLSDAEFKTLVIKMLTEMIEYRHTIEEEMKVMQSEIKRYIQGYKETGTQINDLEQKEEMNIQQEQNEETRIQKSEERFRNLQDNFKCSNIQIIGVPQGEEQEQETKNLLEQIMKEKFPNLVKEIDFQEVQEAQRVPKNGPKEEHTKTNHN